MAESKHQPHTGRSRHDQAGRNQPITRHPLFPAIVALWFAALTGLGSFALRTALLESLVVAAHVDSLVPAAAPPLGLTARLLIALVFGTIGGAIGWFLARHFANPKEAPRHQVFDVADFDLGAPMPAPDRTAVPEAAAPLAEVPAPALDPASLLQQIAQDLPPLATPLAIIEAEEPAAPPPPTAAERIASADLADLSHVELMERLAIALQKREELRDATPVEAADTASPVLHFPDFTDRRSVRPLQPAGESRLAPQETEKALRDALAQLQRMSGGA